MLFLQSLIYATITAVLSFNIHHYTQSRSRNGAFFSKQYKFQQSSQTLHMSSSSPLADRIRDSVLRKYDINQVSRVITCWNDFIAGEKLHRYLDEPENKVLQTADCFVKGLEAKSFHDVSNFPWALGLEKNHKIFLEELINYENKRKQIVVADITQTTTSSVSNSNPDIILQVNPNSHDEGVWLGPRDTSGSHYGPEWKTLGLQDRSVWSEEFSSEFPRTIQIMQDLKVPSCEVFYAKQGPRSGLKPHSDKNNFIMTCHVALDVHEGQCWIKVGDTTHYWKNGKTCIFDTSVIHSTENLSDRTRYVLLVRFWHPDLTSVEVEAFKYIFGCLDHASMGDDALDQYEMKQFLGKDNHAGLQTTASTSSSSARMNSVVSGGSGSGKVSAVSAFLESNKQKKMRAAVDDMESGMSKSKKSGSSSATSSKGFGKK